MGILLGRQSCRLECCVGSLLSVYVVAGDDLFCLFFQSGAIESGLGIGVVMPVVLEQQSEDGQLWFFDFGVLGQGNRVVVVVRPGEVGRKIVSSTEFGSYFCFNSTMHIWQTFNALFIIRSLVKYINETGSEFQLLQHFEAVPSSEVLSGEESAANASESTAIAVEATEEEKHKAIVAVDGSKFETFFDAIVNLVVVIPVK